MTLIRAVATRSKSYRRQGKSFGEKTQRGTWRLSEACSLKSSCLPPIATMFAAPPRRGAPPSQSRRVPEALPLQHD